MEETLGKRIVSHRKRLGLTQDQLAEQLGVTAQAVSKWENDQSCPDITILPKLARIFGISVDTLLGCQPEQTPVFQGEVVTNETEPTEDSGGQWNFEFDGGKKDSLAVAVWVLLVGGILLASRILGWDPAFWSIVWPSALLVFGLFGLYPRFSVFRLGCALAGAYFLLTTLGIGIFSQLRTEYILPIGILLFGVSLLADAVRKPKGKRFSINHENRKKTSTFQQDEDSFLCTTAFGDDSYVIQIPRLNHGETEVSFGELTVDLSGVETVSANCTVDVSCSFGSLLILVPRQYRVVLDSDTAFANVEIQGQHDSTPNGELNLDADASFGTITVRYI